MVDRVVWGKHTTSSIYCTAEKSLVIKREIISFDRFAFSPLTALVSPAGIHFPKEKQVTTSAPFQ